MLSYTSLLDFGRALCSAFFLQNGFLFSKRRNPVASDPYSLTLNPASPPNWDMLHSLLVWCFAGMAGRIDPPSSLARMTAADLAAKAANEDLFVLTLDHHLVGCLFGTPKASGYYVGKLAISPDHRAKGLARQLIDAAAARACDLGCAWLELESRVELPENHATFQALGFAITGQTAHPGYDRPTSFTFRRSL